MGVVETFEGLRLENSSVRVERMGGKILVSDLGEAYRKGRLFCSQRWVKSEKAGKASAYNLGEQGKYKSRFPTVYWAVYNGDIIFIVGDGHHRTADSLFNGLPIKGEVDLELKNLDDERMKNPNIAAQKYGAFGIEGIWPFEEFYRRYKDLVNE